MITKSDKRVKRIKALLAALVIIGGTTTVMTLEYNWQKADEALKTCEHARYKYNNPEECNK